MVAVGSLLFVIFQLGLFILTTVADSRDETPPGECVIPNQVPNNGRCIIASDCPAYLKIKGEGTLTVNKISFMRQIQCHMEPGHVCCPIGKDEAYQNASIAIDSGKIKVRVPYAPPSSLSSELVNRFGEGDSTAAVGSIGMEKENDEDCGLFTDQRIIGGEIAGLDDFPWTALLIYNSSFQYGCSGSLINRRFVLTAAHCVTGSAIEQKGNLVSVRLGEYDTQGNPDCIQEQDGFDCAEEAMEFEVEKVIVHPYYDEKSRNKHHDIALIKTKKPVKYSTYIQPICIPASNLSSGIIPGKRMTLAGWGATDKFQSRLGNILSPIKLFTEVPIVNQTTCMAKFQPYQLELGMGQLCAGGEKDNDSCPGDSGGPLMYFNHQANRFVCSGIVSLGKGEKGKIACGAEGFPGVYTRTDYYIDWIKNAIRHN